MKTQLLQSACRRAFRLGVSITSTLLLLAALPMAAADTPYSATGWVIGVPVPGIWCTNTLGQVGFRGNAHLARVVSTDARLTGRRTIFVDGAAQADGSSIIYGQVYHEVGTWDGTGTNFTATGGVWELSYRGTMAADGSLQLHLVGSGWGGTIDGLRLDETLTRTNGPTLDPAIPYLYVGTVKPPPVNTSEVLDNFDDNILTGWTLFLSPTSGGTGQLVESNQQFTVRGHWPGMITRSLWDTFALGYLMKFWIVGDGKTIEWRADLIGINENTTATKIEVGGYLFYKGRDFVALGKLGIGQTVVMFSCERAAVRNSNVVLAFAMTRAKQNLILTARVLDKTNQNAVLYERTVVDTPLVDHSLTTAEFQAITGMPLSLVAEGNFGPTMSGDLVGLDIWQYNYDGQQPAAEATFDNLELRTSEVPGVSIGRAVRLRWPASSTLNYAVEGAPTAQGPWLPVQDPVLPGFQQMTVPANDIMGFFRLRQAP